MVRAMRPALALLAATLAAVAASAPAGARPAEATREAAASTAGPLRVHPTNSRYFADATGRAVYLTGSHTWWTLARPRKRNPISCAEHPWHPFSFPAYVDRLAALGHNFLRLWRWESTMYQGFQCGGSQPVKPHPWLRTGPGKAADGARKFDLRRLNDAYFGRLRELVEHARARGIYVSVMLFEGWQLQPGHDEPWHWRGHPFRKVNNVNGVSGDLNKDGYGTEIHTLANRRILAIQRRYVRRVVATLADMDNVLYEIANESGGYSTAWQYHMIDFVRRLEAERGGLRHPVGMTFQHRGGDNATLHASAADWISPYGPAYMSDPPAAAGGKVVVSDTDHHCGHLCTEFPFAWKTFTRGMNAIYMDTWAAEPVREAVRRALGATRRLADRLDLSTLTPQNALSSTAYCLCDAGRTYVVYSPGPGWVGVNVGGGGTFAGEWIDPVSGETLSRISVTGSGWVWRNPERSEPVVLLLQRTGG
jgi:hypothetical protein